MPLRRPGLGGKSVSDRMAEFGDAARTRMQPGFEASGVAYPPASVTFVAVKEERVLQVYAGDRRQVKVLEYPVLGQSGDLGPKLREGDRQVPEGLYAIEGLNPNSRFYVSLRLNYPNSFDLARAAQEGRDQPGSDIYIHGRTASVGCLAMGDSAIEELFTLVEDVGPDKVRVIITPVDFRKESLADELPKEPPWVGGLYEQIRFALAALS